VTKSLQPDPMFASIAERAVGMDIALGGLRGRSSSKRSRFDLEARRVDPEEPKPHRRQAHESAERKSESTSSAQAAWVRRVVPDFRAFETRRLTLRSLVPFHTTHMGPTREAHVFVCVRLCMAVTGRRRVSCLLRIQAATSDSASEWIEARRFSVAIQGGSSPARPWPSTTRQ
jgi:hypothetical protein